MCCAKILPLISGRCPASHLATRSPSTAPCSVAPRPARSGLISRVSAAIRPAKARARRSFRGSLDCGSRSPRSCPPPANTRTPRPRSPPWLAHSIAHYQEPMQAPVRRRLAWARRRLPGAKGRPGFVNRNPAPPRPEPIARKMLYRMPAKAERRASGAATGRGKLGAGNICWPTASPIASSDFVFAISGMLFVPTISGPE